MPGGDRTGPFGEGPMTGRGAGYCAGYDRPGFAPGPGFGRGAWRLGRGMGLGRGRGTGGGFGYRYRYYAGGIPFSAYDAPGADVAMERDEEIALLRAESQRARTLLKDLEERLARLEAE